MAARTWNNSEVDGSGGEGTIGDVRVEGRADDSGEVEDGRKVGEDLCDLSARKDLRRRRREGIERRERDGGARRTEDGRRGHGLGSGGTTRGASSREVTHW